MCRDMTLIAKSDSKSYLKIDELENNKSICTYKVTFPVEAGPYDTLDVWLEDSANIGISFGVGNSYLSAQGAERLLD